MAPSVLAGHMTHWASGVTGEECAMVTNCQWYPLFELLEGSTADRGRPFCSGGNVNENTRILNNNLERFWRQYNNLHWFWTTDNPMIWISLWLACDSQSMRKIESASLRCSRVAMQNEMDNYSSNSSAWQVLPLLPPLGKVHHDTTPPLSTSQDAHDGIYQWYYPYPPPGKASKGSSSNQSGHDMAWRCWHAELWHAIKPLDTTWQAMTRPIPENMFHPCSHSD